MTPAFCQEAFADDGITVFEPAGFIEHADVSSGKAVQARLRDPCVSPQGSQEGDEKPFHGSICTAFIERDGRWQLALTADQAWRPDPETVR
jgi:hypothetical protein